MDRADFFKMFSMGTAAITSGVPFILSATSGTSGKQKSRKKFTDTIPTPTPAQFQWQEAELAALVCWDLHAHDGEFYVQSEARITPVEDINIFNPQKYDTDQWIKTLKEAGFRIAILTVSHETGFFHHQSDATPYSMKALKWQNGKGDILRDFKKSCEKYGMLPGVYIGTRWNTFYGIYDFKVSGDNQFAENRQQYYNRMIEKIVEEIFSRYGDWAMVWFDGGAHGPEQGGPDVLSVFEKYQPNGLFYHNLQRADIRWGGSETGTVSYPCWGTFPYKVIGAGESSREEIAANNYQLLKTGDPDGEYYIPAMSDAPLRGNEGHDWFWEPDREHTIYPVEDLVEMYYKSVGRNSTLILGVTPNPSGLLPKKDSERLKAWGKEIKQRFEDPIAQTGGKGSEYFIELQPGTQINHAVIQEDIRLGERVRTYTIEAKIDGSWQKICSGSCIGHKRIERFDTLQCIAVKLIIDESVKEPLITKFSVFNVA